MDGSGWDTPIPLGKRGTLPDMPLDAFPGWLADMIGAVAEEAQTPVDLPGCVALSVLSTAAGGRAVVNIRGTWTEPVNVFVVVAMPPASRKSPVFRTMTAPLVSAEKTLTEQYGARIIEARLAKRVAAEAAEKAARTAAGKQGGASPDDLAEAASTAMAADEIEVPPEPRLTADDITPEAAATLMAAQGGRVAVLSAEGGIFATLAGRYSGVANLDLFLKGHAGDPMAVDRRGRHERIDHAALTLGLAVQPDIIKEIANAPGFRGKGLLGRILYSLPASNVGYRKVDAAPVPPKVVEQYNSSVKQLVLAMYDWQDPARLQLTDDAADLFTAHRERTESRLRPHQGDLSHIADWAGKYDGAVARLAGLLHLAGHVSEGWRQPITADTLDAAAKLGNYFTVHALAAFDSMGADPDLDAARVILDWLTKNRVATFTRRDIYRPLHRRFRKATDLDPGLRVLAEHGWIRELDNERSRTSTYLTHPDVHGHGAQPPSTTP